MKHDPILVEECFKKLWLVQAAHPESFIAKQNEFLSLPPSR
jgi:hypothetical protein